MYKDSYKKEGICGRCGKNLTGQQKNWCSKKCSRLGLKRLYKQRYPEKMKAYRKKQRSEGMRPMSSVRVRGFLKDKICTRCKTSEQLNVHHIVPRRSGGTHEINNLMPLCFSCHMEWEKRMKGYWI